MIFFYSARGEKDPVSTSHARNSHTQHLHVARRSLQASHASKQNCCFLYCGSFLPQRNHCEGKYVLVGLFMINLCLLVLGGNFSPPQLVLLSDDRSRFSPTSSFSTAKQRGRHSSHNWRRCLSLCCVSQLAVIWISHFAVLHNSLWSCSSHFLVWSLMMMIKQIKEDLCLHTSKQVLPQKHSLAVNISFMNMFF